MVGIIEKDGGTLYCSVGFFEPGRGLVYKRRKVSRHLHVGRNERSALREFFFVLFVVSRKELTSRVFVGSTCVCIVDAHRS